MHACMRACMYVRLYVLEYFLKYGQVPTVVLPWNWGKIWLTNHSWQRRADAGSIKWLSWSFRQTKKSELNDRLTKDAQLLKVLEVPLDPADLGVGLVDAPIQKSWQTKSKRLSHMTKEPPRVGGAVIATAPPSCQAILDLSHRSCLANRYQSDITRRHLWWVACYWERIFPSWCPNRFWAP